VTGEALGKRDVVLSAWKPTLERTIPAGSDQVLLVLGEEASSSAARVYLIERTNGRWKIIYGPIDGMAGRRGFASPGEKKEGDGRTPIGVYPLELAFGYAPESLTKMVYRQALDDDVWVDDPDSPDYNRWVKRGETRAASFEWMRRQDGLYRYGVVIGYNTNPVIMGLGSAIFLHVWKGRDKPTAGCIAVSADDLVGILGRLDASQKPLAILQAKKALK
jgi:L,D-peptidoglycan transpeptidase YkuD (ErfK/YbiS/YcfS/YnhG family)